MVRNHGAAEELGVIDDAVAFSIVPVRDVPRDVASIEQLINAIGALGGPISLEIGASSQRRFLIIRCKVQHAALVQAQMTSLYGSPVFEMLDPANDPAIRMEASESLVATGRMKLKVGPHLPLLTWRELEENDPVLALMGAAGTVRVGESALSQVLIHGRAPDGWAGPYIQELLRIKRRGFGTFRGRDLLRLVCLGIGTSSLAFYTLAGTFAGAWFSAGPLFTLCLSASCLYVGAPLLQNPTRGAHWDESLEALVESKVQRTAYSCEIRLAASAATADRARQIVHRLAAAYNQFSQDAGNQLRLVPPDESPQFTAANLTAWPPAESLLNAAEIAGMWHLPISEVPDLLPASRVQIALPVPEQVTDPKGLHIGLARKSSGVQVPVYLPHDALERHMLLVGRTRMGKTTIAQHVACWAMRQPGRGLVVVDPHRDMVEELLGHIPPDREQDVVLVDLADDDYVAGFNLLDVHQSGDPEKVVEAFIDVAYVLWAGYWGPRMVVPLRMLLTALVLANTQRSPEQQFTILALAPLISLTRERRSRFLREMLPGDNPLTDGLIAYFETEYDDLTPSFQERVISPVLSKARAFEFNSRIRAMVGQPASTINPWRFVADGKIVLFHTARPTVGDEFASFMGSLILNYVRRAILAQGAVQPDRRVPVTVIVDESQTMAAVDYPSIMAEAQKFGASLVLSTQGLATLEPSMQRENLARAPVDRQLLANTDTLVVFRVAGDDAGRISEREFGEEVPPTTLTNLPQYSAYVRTVLGRQVVPPFAVETLPMAPADPSGKWRVQGLRAGYAVPARQAAEAAHQAVNVILRYFGTEVAAATAVHDGAFGDLLGPQLAFPQALQGNLVEGPNEGREGPRSKVEKAHRAKPSAAGGKVKTDAPMSAVEPPGPHGSPRKRMLDLLDEIEGWDDDPAPNAQESRATASEEGVEVDGDQG